LAAAPVATDPLSLQALPVAECTEVARVARPDASAEALLPAVTAEVAECTEVARVARPDASAEALLPAAATEVAEDTTLGVRPRSGFSCQRYATAAAAASASRAHARSTFHVFSWVRAC
jgi:hypothetical protein